MSSRETENSNKSLSFLNDLVSCNQEMCFTEEPEDLDHDNDEELNVLHEKNLQKMALDQVSPYG